LLPHAHFVKAALLNREQALHFGMYELASFSCIAVVKFRLAKADATGAIINGEFSIWIYLSCRRKEK
jgi:hypothetical protein